jgi:hypothetical protein
MGAVKKLANERVEVILERMDAIMDELDGLSHVSEREFKEELDGEFKDLERELVDLVRHDWHRWF